MKIIFWISVTLTLVALMWVLFDDRIRFRSGVIIATIAIGQLFTVCAWALIASR